MARIKAAKANVNDMFDAITELVAQRGISRTLFIEKLETAIGLAIRKDYNVDNVRVNLDSESGKMTAHIVRVVKERIENPEGPEDYFLSGTHILPEDAIKYNKKAKIGDEIEIPVENHEFGRIAATAAKQMIRQGIREVEQVAVVEKLGDKIGQIVPASVTRVDPVSGVVTLNFEEHEIPLFKSDQLPTDAFEPGDIVRVYISDIVPSERKTLIKITRTSIDFIKKLLEMEVPEIADGIVEIKASSREAGVRTKLAVISNDENIDPISACIGENRIRVTTIVKELGTEKLDIIPFSENPGELIANALAPATVVDVDVDEAARTAKVKVPDHQLSLAIGQKGNNAMLAARLTGYKIDIRPESGYYGEE